MIVCSRTALYLPRYPPRVASVLVPVRYHSFRSNFLNFDLSLDFHPNLILPLLSFLFLM